MEHGGTDDQVTDQQEVEGPDDVDLSDPGARRWSDEAIRRVEAEAARSADTHLLQVRLADSPGIELYLKDESAHPTGSLKHRLARSLFLYGLANGWIREGSTVVEASSGSTAVSEAYFARMLELEFIAVMPAGTSSEKVELIEGHGGTCRFVERPADAVAEARRIAASRGGHYMDQFTHAERATDWRGNNNIAESIFGQLREEPHPIPTWIVVGAGTGGTSATIGRYLRYRRHDTRLAVVDPVGSAFFESWVSGDDSIRAECRSVIEGIGRPVVEPSFLPSVIDRMIQVDDAASIAAMRVLRDATGLDVGGSTGTNLWGAMRLIDEMRAQGVSGSVVSLICDGGERYRDTYCDDEWVARHGFELTGPSARISVLLEP